jgi:aerobic-type carbon monoxide dehydrogenase small subunit (CoxS/CutS family)
LKPPEFAYHAPAQLDEAVQSPGMLMTALDFLNTVPNPTEAQIRGAMSAVICRCTGYQGIVNTVAAAAK